MALVLATGFEFGTTAGWTTGNAGNKIVDTATAGCTLTTSTPRSGSYCLDVTASAASQGVEWTTNTIGSSMNRLRAVFAVRFVGSLPGAGVNIAFVDSGNSALVKYDSVGTRLQVQIEGGSNVNGPTVVADTWYVIEIYLKTSANPHTMDWWVDGAAQTQATSAVAASTISGGFGLGWPFTPQTFQCRYDDVVVATDTADIAGPVGAHKVVLLSVDPAGTVTVNGSAASFSTFTNNGTLNSTFDATTARDAVDEVPPTIGATADGWVQDAIAASDYVEMPMTSYTLGGGETVAGLRMLVPGWATSTTATNIRFDAFNGTTAETVFALGDPNFDNSTTAPAWVCRMLPTLANYDSQAELDGLAFRGGFGTDANPDCGIHAIYAELVVAEAAGGVVEKTVATTWDVFTTVEKTTATGWDTTTAVEKTTATTWDTRALVEQSVATTWDVAAVIQRTVATTWDLLSTVEKTVATGWDTAAIVEQAVATTWDVFSTAGTTQVEKTVATTWDTAAVVEKTTASTWDLWAVVQQAVPTSWDLFTTVQTTTATTWDVTTGVSKTVTTSWDLAALVELAIATTWDVAAIGPPPVIIRPDTGTIARPGTGTITRPATGTVSRPATGIIIRPNTGTVPRP